jgi:acyl dehydratase
MRSPVSEPYFPRLRRRFTQDMVDRYGRVNEDRNLIHYDAEAARRAGFERPVVHGAIVAALLSEACRDFFGRGWLESGRLKLAFIKPVLVDQAVTTGARIVGGTPRDADRRIMLEVWCQNEAGERVVAGEASAIRAEM